MSLDSTRPAGVRELVELAPYTTLKLGGPARYFLEARDEAALCEALAWTQAQALPVALIGGGSNLVIADDGFPGLVIALRTRGIAISAIEQDARGEAIARVTAAAGEPWDDFVARCVSEDLAGIECLSGIPGLVGATPIQNVGAYGQEVSHSIASVRVLDRSSLQMRVLEASECAFAYRDSALKRDPERYVVLEVTFILYKGGAPIVRYAELSNALASSSDARVTLAQIRETVIRLRRAKSMVLPAADQAADENSRSAGSFFLNPIVPSEQADALAARLLAEGTLARSEDLPRYVAGSGHVKLAAAWLIEAAGFRKGERRGAVGLSTRHALALTCHDGATTEELLTFAHEITERVYERFGVRLEREPVALGIPSR